MAWKCQYISHSDVITPITPAVPTEPIFSIQLRAYHPDVIVYSKFYLNRLKGRFYERLNFALSHWNVAVNVVLHQRTARDWLCFISLRVEEPRLDGTRSLAVLSQRNRATLCVTECFAVTQAHSRLFKLLPFESLCAVSYSPSIVTISLARIVSETSEILVENRDFFHFPVHSTIDTLIGGGTRRSIATPFGMGKTRTV